MQIKSANVPKILFIKGIFKKDCTSDDIFEKKILENSNTIENEMVIVSGNALTNTQSFTNFINYQKLPNIFHDIASWEKKTNLLCWNCTLQFQSVPVFIPRVIEPVTSKFMASHAPRTDETHQKYSISVQGVFCSFGCARQYIETHNYSISEKTEKLNKLRLLHKLFYNNTKMKEVTSYPIPLEMKQFGGDLTIEDFREQLEKFKKDECCI